MSPRKALTVVSVVAVSLLVFQTPVRAQEGEAAAAGAQGITTETSKAQTTAAQAIGAQTSEPTVFTFCYIPRAGIVYRIKTPDTFQACLGRRHVEFSWTDGKLADGSVTEAKLAFETATQAELDAFIAALGTKGRINQPTNPVAWVQLKGVPDGFADGTDDTGGTSSDVDCVGCVDVDELADGAVTEAKLANGSVTEAKLAFETATQAELDALGTPGTVNDPGNPVAWSQLEGVPDGFADGTDDGGGGVTNHGALGGLTADDHPQYLLANGVRDATDGFAVTATVFNDGAIPASGAGVRLMWYPGKGAFRAGRVDGSEWDDNNIGVSSTAMGINTTAIGTESTAMGGGTHASGGGSTAMGSRTRASGEYSTSMGRSTTAQSFASLVIGRANFATGSRFSWVPTDPLFVAGNGGVGSFGTLSNALTLLKNGNLQIAGSLTEHSDIRLKEDIEPLEGVLPRVLDLEPIRYRFREGTGHPAEPQLGLAAQDVQPHFPELVRRGADGYLSLAYADLSAVLVGAIQEQQGQIEAQTAAIGELRRELDAQGRVIEALRARNAALTGRFDRRLAAIEAAIGSEPGMVREAAR